MIVLIAIDCFSVTGLSIMYLMMDVSGYQMHPIRIEKADIKVEFKVMTQRNEQTSLELEHYINKADTPDCWKLFANHLKIHFLFIEALDIFLLQNKRSTAGITIKI